MSKTTFKIDTTNNRTQEDSKQAAANHTPIQRNLTLKEQLKRLYKTQDKIPQLIEGLGEEVQSIKDYYVKLNILLSENASRSGSSESVSGTQEAIELKDIFNKPENNKILILGGAGVGKTTLMQHIAYSWSESGLWSDKFDYVYKLTLKQLLTDSCKTFINPGSGSSRLEAFISYNLANGDIDKADEIYKAHTSGISEIVLNDKTLIIIDGYDEIKHLNNNSPEYKIIQEKIMGQDAKHKLIMTSRPNAADKSLKQKFSALINNEGLGDDGIKDYIKKQFKSPEAQNQIIGQLDKHPNIKELCKIPVNISMLCSIFSEDNKDTINASTSNQELANLFKIDDINNMGDLYQKMIATLGRRFFAKHYDDDSSKELIDRLNNGKFDIKELKVLQDLASHGFKRDEALTFRGASGNIEDKEDNTVQAAINRVSDKEHWSQDHKPTISHIYKYGILKTETDQE